MVEAEEYSDQASEDSVWLLCPSPTAVVTPALLVTSAKPRIRVAQAVNNEAAFVEAMNLRRESVTNVMGSQNSVWSPIRPN